MLKTMLCHSSGSYLESEMIILTSKNDAQGLGSGITYARRYALMAICGLGADDDDGNAASAPAPAQSPRPATPKAVPKAFDTSVKFEPASTEHKMYAFNVIKNLGMEEWFKMEMNKKKLVAALEQDKPVLSTLEDYICEKVKA